MQKRGWHLLHLSAAELAEEGKQRPRALPKASECCVQSAQKSTWSDSRSITM